LIVEFPEPDCAARVGGGSIVRTTRVT
jgi:hypothetical protein